MLTKRKNWSRSKLYDWDKWLSKTRFTLTEGKDFECGRGAIVLQVRMAAYRRGALVSVKETPTGVAVTVRQKPTRPFPPAKSPEIPTAPATKISGVARGKK